MPNTPAIALNRHGDAAGTAAAVLGAAQFAIGGSVAPLVGALGQRQRAVPMAGDHRGTRRPGRRPVLVRPPVAQGRLDPLTYGPLGPPARIPQTLSGA